MSNGIPYWRNQIQKLKVLSSQMNTIINLNNEFISSLKSCNISMEKIILNGKPYDEEIISECISSSYKKIDIANDIKNKCNNKIQEYENLIRTENHRQILLKMNESQKKNMEIKFYE